MEFEFSQSGLPQFAVAFWTAVAGKTVFLFSGPMGAGKTTTIAALCRAKGVVDAPSSPTFSIINEYAYPEHGVLKKLYHIDLYRLKNLDEIIQAGVEDCVYSGALCFIEWPEKAPELFDQNAVHVVLQTLSETARRATIHNGPAFGAQAGAPPL